MTWFFVQSSRSIYCLLIKISNGNNTTTILFLLSIRLIWETQLKKEWENHDLLASSNWIFLSACRQHLQVSFANKTFDWNRALISNHSTKMFKIHESKWSFLEGFVLVDQWLMNYWNRGFWKETLKLSEKFERRDIFLVISDDVALHCNVKIMSSLCFSNHWRMILRVLKHI